MRYDVVFNGEFSPEHDINEAKQKLAKIFKLKPATVDKLFSGQSVTIRKNVDATTAEKYRKAAAGCGVIFELDPAEASSEVPPAQVAAARDATMVICPACGCSQSRATTCLRCGEFLIKPEETTSRPAPIAKVTVPVSSAENAAEGSRHLWKKARIGLLLLVLFIVGMNTVMTGRWTTDWDETLWVGIYPINGDGQEHVGDYINALDEESFRPIVDYFNEEAEAHGLPLAEPFTIHLAPVVTELPPEPPAGRNPLAVIWWSLKMRYWVYRHDTFTAGPSPDIKIFTVYHDGRRPNPLENSLGLRKGLFGVVHAYADYRLEPKNQVVIAHEILHGRCSG